MQSRSRFIYSWLVVLVIALGLLSRRFPQFLPAAFGKFPGDALWALMVFIGFGVLFPRAPTLWLAAASLFFSFSIEFSQLYHAPWIDGVRATSFGHLVLGSGFLWADLAAYTLGILAGATTEWLVMRRRATSISA